MNQAFKIKTAIPLFIFCLLSGLGCVSENGKDKEISLAFSLSAVKNSSQSASASKNAPANTIAKVLAVNRDSSKKLRFDIPVTVDKDNWLIVAKSTIKLKPGKHDFYILLDNNGQHAGVLKNQTIGKDCALQIDMLPVLGNPLSNVDGAAALSRLKPDGEFSQFSFIDIVEPLTGLTINGGPEEILKTNPDIYTADFYLNLPPGSHKIGVNLYNGSLRYGVSEETDVHIQGGATTTKPVAPLGRGVRCVRPRPKENDAEFHFNISPEVIEEAGGRHKLKVLFSIVGDRTPLRETFLNINSRDEATVVYKGLKHDNLTMSLTFFEKPCFYIGHCVQSFVLNEEPRDIFCGLILRRKALIGGRLLSTVGLNVFTQAYEPVAGALVYAGSKLMGISGSGSFGTPGYLKLLLLEGRRRVSAFYNQQLGWKRAVLAPLGISNFDLILKDIDFKLPDSGQTSSFTDTFGEDSDYSLNPPSHASVDDILTLDEMTNLVWQREDADIRLRWNEAVGYCDNLTLGGYSDWRLPSIRELLLISDYEKSRPSINLAAFPGADSFRYWSSSVSSRNSSKSWTLNFKDGSAKIMRWRYKYYARCVRGDEYIANFFSAGDGVVKDNITGLSWLKNSELKKWEQALEYCELLEFGGRSDWRLPNIKELHSIADVGRYPAIGADYFDFHPNTKKYWSSTSNIAKPFKAWSVDFASGRVDSASKYYRRAVRCVGD